MGLVGVGSWRGATWSIVAAVSMSLGGASLASIDLEFRAVSGTVAVGDVAEVGLYAVSDDPGASQSFGVTEVIFAWDPDFLRFLGIDDTGGVPLLLSSVPFPHASGLNEADPPQDGDGLYMAWPSLGDTLFAPPEGILITTFRFEALEPTASTLVDILPEWSVNPSYITFVLDGKIPGLIVTGELVGATVEIVVACPEDINGDGVVDVEDLLAVLGTWGEGGVPADVNGDGIVDVEDLLAVLGAWGLCPPP